MANEATYKINFKGQFDDLTKLRKEIEQISQSADIKLTSGGEKDLNLLMASLDSVIKKIQEFSKDGTLDLNQYAQVSTLIEGIIKKVDTFKKDLAQVTVSTDVSKELDKIQEKIQAINTENKQLGKEKGKLAQTWGLSADNLDIAIPSKAQKDRTVKQVTGGNLTDDTGLALNSYDKLMQAQAKIDQTSSQLTTKQKEIINAAKQVADALKTDANIAIEQYQKTAAAIDKNREKVANLQQQYKDTQSGGLDLSNLTESAKKATSAITELGDNIQTGLVNAENEANSVTEKLNRKYIELGNNTDNVKKQVDSYDSSLSKNSSTLGRAVNNVISYGTALTLVRRIYRQLISTIKEMDQALTNMTVVTQLTREQAWGLTETLQQVAVDTGFATTEIAQMTTMYLQQGKTLTDAITLTEAAAKAARIAGISGSESINLLTNAMNGFQMSADKAMEVSDKFAALAASAATNYEELATALSKVAAQANLAGMSMDFTLGMLTKGIEVTREAPETIGTALKTVISRMRELTDYGKTLEDGVDVNRVDKALKNIGVSLLDDNREFRSLEDVLSEVGQKWDTLNKNQQANIAVALAGTRQQSRLIAMMQDWDRTQQLVTISMSSAGTTAAQHAKYMQGLEAATTRLTTSYQKFITSLTNSNSAIKVLNVLSKALETLSDHTGIVFGALGSLGAVLLLNTKAKIEEAYATMMKNEADKEEERLKRELIIRQNEEYLGIKNLTEAEREAVRATNENIIAAEKQEQIKIEARINSLKATKDIDNQNVAIKENELAIIDNTLAQQEKTRADIEDQITEAKKSLEQANNTVILQENTKATYENALAMAKQANDTEKIAELNGLLQQTENNISEARKKQVEQAKEVAKAEKALENNAKEIEKTNKNRENAVKELTEAQNKQTETENKLAEQNSLYDISLQKQLDAQTNLNRLTELTNALNEKGVAGEKTNIVQKILSLSVDKLKQKSALFNFIITKMQEAGQESLNKTEAEGTAIATANATATTTKAAATTADTAATVANNAAHKSLNATLKANPFILLISAIAIVIAAMVALTKKDEEFAAKMEELKKSLGDLLKAVMSILKPIIDIVMTLIDALLTALKPILDMIVNTLTDIMSVVTAILEPIGSILNVVGQVVGVIMDLIKWLNDLLPVMQWVTDAVKAVTGLFSGLFSTIGGWIKGIFGWFGDLFKSAEQKADEAADAIRKNQEKIYENKERKNTLKPLLDEYDALSNKTYKTTEDLERLKELESQIGDVSEDYKVNGVVDIEKARKDLEARQKETDRRLKENLDSAFYGASLGVGKRDDDFKAAITDYYSEQAIKAAESGKLTIKEAQRVSEALTDIYKEMSTQELANLNQGKTNKVYESVLNFERELSNEQTTLTKKAKEYQKVLSNLPKEAKKGFEAAYRFYDEVNRLVSQAGKEGAKNFEESLNALGIEENIYFKIRDSFEDLSDADKKRLGGSFDKYFISALNDARGDRTQAILNLLKNVNDQSLINVITESFVKSNQMAIEDYTKARTKYDNILEQSIKARSGEITIEEIRVLAEENEELFADAKFVEQFMRGEVDLTEQLSQARKETQEQLREDLILQEKVAEQQIANITKQLNTEKNLTEEKRKTLEAQKQNYEMQRNLAKVELQQLQYEKLYSMDLWKNYYNLSKLEIQRLKWANELLQIEQESEKSTSNRNKLLERRLKIYAEEHKANEQLLNDERYRTLRDLGVVEIGQDGTIIVDMSLKEIYPQYEEEFQWVNNNLEALSNAQKEENDLVNSVKEVATGILDEQKEQIEKLKDVYSDYFSRLDATIEEQERETTRDELTRQIAALSGGSDSATAALRKDLLQQLESLTQEEQDARKQDARDALQRGLDEKVKKIEEYTESISKNITTYAEAEQLIYNLAGVIPHNATGGLVNYTGLSWVDGTPSRPEAFLSAEQTKLFEQLAMNLQQPNILDTVNNVANNSQINIGAINITTPELNSSQDFRTAGQIFAEEFDKAIRQRGINVNVRN